MDVSIIIVNYNSAKLVKDCIKSIREKTENISYEIIVVDNDSKDNSVEYLRENFADTIKLIEAGANLGFGRANNLGADNAEGEYLFLLNPDTYLVNNAIKILVDYLKEHPEAGVAGGNLYSPQMNPAGSFCMQFDTLELEKKKASWSSILWGKTGDKLSEKLHFHKGMNNPIQKTFNSSGQPMEVAYIFGADMMIAKSLFNQVNGFDKDFFMYAEEEDLSWRIHETGKKSISVPQAQIVHLEGQTTVSVSGFPERQFRMRMNGGMTYYYKRNGIDGAKQYYHYRKKRFQHLIAIARLRGKDLKTIEPARQLQCLEEEYRKFIKKIGEL